MRFLFIGHGASYNHGSEAIMRTTINLLRNEFKDSEFIVTTANYKYECNVSYGSGVKIIPSYFEKLWQRFSPEWFYRNFYKYTNCDFFLPLIFRRIRSYVEKADVIISVGGDNYSADYGSIDDLLWFTRLAKMLKKKIVIWGASIGPFVNNLELKKIINNLASVDLITARETLTIQYLASLGIVNNVKRVADTAFLLEPEPVNLTEIHNFPLDKLVGFNISPILSKFRLENNTQNIQTLCVEFIKRIIDEGMYVLLIPHVNKPDAFDSDYNFMETILRELGSIKTIGIVKPHYNAMQLKYIISKCRFFIGARTHATIAAFSSGVPTLSIGYSLKARGINQDLFGHADYVVDIKKLTAQMLYEKLDVIRSSELEIKESLLQAVPLMKELAIKNIQYLKEFKCV